MQSKFLICVLSTIWISFNFFHPFRYLFAPIPFLCRELFQKECSKLASVGMSKKSARSMDEKNIIITKKYEKPILTKAEDGDIENAEHMYELEFNGDLPPSVVG